MHIRLIKSIHRVLPIQTNRITVFFRFNQIDLPCFSDLIRSNHHVLKLFLDSRPFNRWLIQNFFPIGSYVGFH
ncbi:hypothetical protein HanRHA438_Chr07g0321261 [Helianthus annuus]|nr:hypothetical protein HanRHA438_Chr07g0321261 [Helianthus annuus]